MKKEMKARELAKQLVNYTNSLCGPPGEDAFIEEIICSHGTLQQSVFKMFLRVIEAWANTEDDRYDLRNEATIKYCKEIVKIVRSDHIPMI